jgi:hypothetical protein
LIPEDYDWIEEYEKWHGTHVTLQFGKNHKPVKEVNSVLLIVHGHYNFENVAGLLVTYSGSTNLHHITLCTRNGANPVDSNKYLKEALGEEMLASYAHGVQAEGVVWHDHIEILEGWTGNYYR